MAGTSEKIDIEKAKKAAEHVLNLLGGAVLSGMILSRRPDGTVSGVERRGRNDQPRPGTQDRAARTVDS